MKILITQLTLDRLRVLAAEKGMSDEKFDKWVEDYVIILEPFYD